MSHIHMFFNFIRANCKRLLHYLPSTFVSLLLLLLLTGTAGFYLSRHLYKENVFSAISIGYYLPQDDNLDLNQLGIGMLQDLEGMEETVQLVQVNSVEEGYNMLASHEILYLIIVPEQFFSGIMDSTNVPLDIVVYDNSSISSYIINELFMSYAGLLGTAQAGIYSGLDTTRAHEFTPEQIRELSNRVNFVYLDRVMNKTNYMKTIQAEDAGSVTLTQHYAAFAIILSLCFLAFLLIPYLQGTGNGICECMKLYHLNRGHILAANMIHTFLALYILFLPCYIGISIWMGHANLNGLLTIIPALLLIALLIAGIATFSRSTFSANICLLFVVLVLAYCGGGLLPDVLLPKVIQQIRPYLPGTNFTSKAILVHAGRPAHLNWNLCIASSEKPVHRNPCCRISGRYQCVYDTVQRGIRCQCLALSVLLCRCVHRCNPGCTGG